jgi:hypothetical protein
MIHAVLAGAVYPEHQISLLCTAGLSLAWAFVAARVFRKRGWQ